MTTGVMMSKVPSYMEYINDYFAEIDYIADKFFEGDRGPAFILDSLLNEQKDDVVPIEHIYNTVVGLRSFTYYELVTMPLTKVLWIYVASRITTGEDDPRSERQLNYQINLLKASVVYLRMAYGENPL